MTPKRTVILFDVNETLLDLHGLDESFAALFSSPRVRGDWFKQLLQLSLLANTLEDYFDFAVLSGRALTMVAEQHGRTLSERESQSILTAIRGLRPHDDVAPALDMLAASGFRLATLTNSPLGTLEAQLASAGLTDRFEQRLSVDAVKRYKPAGATYQYAARELGVPVGEIVMVAAHGWDVVGAMRTGAEAAFVARPGQVLIPDAPIPSIVAPTLTGVAEQLVSRFH